MAWEDEEAVSFEGVEVKAVTELALLIDCSEDEAVWIPKSQLLDGGNFGEDTEVGDSGELLIPEWLALEKGLV